LLYNSITFPYERKLFAIVRNKLPKREGISRRKGFKFTTHVQTLRDYTIVHDTRDRGNHVRGPFVVTTESGVSYLGRVPIQTHVRPPTAVAPPVSVFIQASLGLLPLSLIEGENNISRLHLATASWYNVHETFKLYSHSCEGYDKNKRTPIRSVLSSIIPFLKRLKLPFVVSCPIADDIYNIDLKAAAHPGLLTRRAIQLVTGLSKHPFNKGECVDFMLPIFEEKFEKVLNGEYNDEPGVYSVGGKEKNSLYG
jgi:hypothetical protein